MIVVDSTVLVDYFRGVFNPQTNWFDRESARRPLAITDLTLCEILQGIGDEGMYKRVFRDLNRFTVFNTGGKEIAVAAADHYRALRAKGFTTRATIDCIIATYCIVYGHTLLHRDRDFDPFEKKLGLAVLHP